MHTELARLDLNLLVLFDALMERRNVTAAAASVQLTQSAASHALRRLREHLGDALFVRGAGGLVPTPRAEALARGVRSALATLEHAMKDGATFDPATSTRTFRVGAADAFDIVVLPKLVRRFASDAPRAQISVVRPPPKDIAAELETGAIDVYYGVLPNQPAFEGLLPDPGERALRTMPVHDEGWVCLVRAGHPRVRRGPTLRQYASEGHVLFSPTGEGTGIVDRLLAEHGLERHVAVRVASFHSALECVRDTDLLWTGPQRIASELDPKRKLRHVRAPLPLPDYPVRIVWHERFEDDRGHRWLRERIAEAAVGTELTRRARPAPR